MNRVSVAVALGTVSLFVLSLCVAAWFERTSFGQRIAKWLGLDDYDDFEELDQSSSK